METVRIVGHPEVNGPAVIRELSGRYIHGKSIPQFVRPLHRRYPSNNGAPRHYRHDCRRRGDNERTTALNEQHGSQTRLASEKGFLLVELVAYNGTLLKRAMRSHLPLPLILPVGFLTLFAQAAAAPIIPDRAMLSGMAPRAHVVLGWADKNLKAHCEALSPFHEIVQPLAPPSGDIETRGKRIKTKRARAQP